MSNPVFTMKIAHTCDCGQAHEQIVTMIADSDFHFSLIGPTMPPIDPAREPFTIPAIGRPRLELTGHYGDVEMTGIEFKGRLFTCIKCGKDVLFP